MSTRMTRGSAPGTGTSRAHSSGTAEKPMLRAATAGNSALRSSVSVKMQLTTSLGCRSLSLRISRSSPSVAPRTAWASLRSTDEAPRRAKSRIRRRVYDDPRRARRLAGPLRSPSTSAAFRRRCAPSGRSSRRSGPKRMRCSVFTRWPTASHMRLTWWLRPSWIVSSSRPGLIWRTFAGAVRPSSRSTPSRSVRSARSDTGTGRTAARYVRGTSNEGCVRRCARSPSFVTRMRPVLSASSRPTGYSRAPRDGTRSTIVRRPCGSAAVESTPLGLWTRKTIRSSGPSRNFPSTATPLSMSTSRAGSVTVLPAIDTRPERMISSAPRRDATPAWARNLARRTPTMVAGGPSAQPLLSGDDALRARAARDARGARRARRELGRGPRARRVAGALLPGLPRRRRPAWSGRHGRGRRVRARAEDLPAPGALRHRREQPHPAPGDEPRGLQHRARAGLGGRPARDRARLEDGRRGPAALVGRPRPRVRRRDAPRRVGGRPRRPAQARVGPLAHARRPRARGRRGADALRARQRALRVRRPHLSRAEARLRWGYGSRAARAHARRRRAARLPRPPGVVVGGTRRRRLRRDDRRSRGAARAAGRRGAVLVAERRRGGARARRHRQDAVSHR